MSAPVTVTAPSFAPMYTLPELAPIQLLLDDPCVNDILINTSREVFVEREGRLERTACVFSNEEALRDAAEAICRAVGRTLDPARPLVDARLADGSRVNIIAPPLSVDGTTISIRKFARSHITLDDMVARGSMSKPLGEFLKICGRCRLNIVISGGTGSGKTTLLNAISQFIDEGERVVTVEDAAELHLQKRHVVRLETRPLIVGEDEYSAVTTRDLVRNALRMRPDRIIVGEVRGPEAFDMMQAMNSGHEGSLTTVHANHPRDALFRLENMISMSGFGLPLRVIRGQISSALHLIIQISRSKDGQRRVTHVSEIVGMEGDVLTMQDLFEFHANPQDPSAGQWRFSGIIPRCFRRIAYWGQYNNLSEALGIHLPAL